METNTTTEWMWNMLEITWANIGGTSSTSSKYMSDTPEILDTTLLLTSSLTYSP
jgi:hypothetical protein